MFETGMCFQGIAAAQDQNSATGVLHSIGQSFTAGGSTMLSCCYEM